MLQETRFNRDTKKTPIRNRSTTKYNGGPIKNNNNNNSMMNIEKFPDKLPYLELQKQEFQAPEDGKLLQLLNEYENSMQEKILEGQISSFYINEGDNKEILLALQADIMNSQIRRQLTYNACYHQDMLRRLTLDEPDYYYCLRKHQVKESLRAKMIDWMLEVFGNYKKTTNQNTYFRAVCIMDLYMKRQCKIHQDGDLHLIGVASMFLATKTEDIYHIPLVDFVKRVAHDKFSDYQIKQMESDIIDMLNYQVMFPTHITYLNYYFYQCFSLNDNPQLQNILDTSIYILKMILHDYQLTEYPSHLLAAVSLGYALFEYFSTRLEELKSPASEQVKKLQQRSQDMIIQLSNTDPSIYKACQNKVQTLINKFQDKYPDLHNLEKFG